MGIRSEKGDGKSYILFRNRVRVSLLRTVCSPAQSDQSDQSAQSESDQSTLDNVTRLMLSSVDAGSWNVNGKIQDSKAYKSSFWFMERLHHLEGFRLWSIFISWALFKSVFIAPVCSQHHTSPSLCPVPCPTLLGYRGVHSFHSVCIDTSGTGFS